ncbi:MAG: hypothetical protein AB7T49_04860 [Oligoflexales bacterium]
MKKSVLFSAAVSSMLMASVALADSTKAPAAAKTAKTEAKGECHGINACKGKGECGGKGHSCAGNNECKGKGWLSATKEECTAKKGTFKAHD